MSSSARPQPRARCRPPGPPVASGGSDMAALVFVAVVVILAVAGGFLGADSRDGADWSPPTRSNGERRGLQGL
jgi:hypothetical protein